ncbi:hypothetical protein CTAYLR_003081 [Chrysophaeum taylorii]|uniref:Sulfotransferase n=1 Tax=Chrysophaeum taylorii TaxID=2483200 RepID=A0AAD7U7J1_9STRA|nr:hypothetical protein CTAYLR_003081 [Chrysophaeum taylorii]
MRVLVVVVLVKSVSGVPAAAPRCFEENGERHCLPILLGVASVRAGTTSLATYLAAHPKLSWGTRKEHHWFRFLMRKDEASGPFSVAEMADGSLREVNVTFSTGGLGEGTAFPAISQVGRGDWRSYARQFGPEYGFDFDPCYLAHGMLSRASMMAIKETLPNAKILAVFRDPAHQHCSRLRDNVRRCADALSVMRTPDAECKGPARPHFHNYCYVEHVEEWWREFGRHNVLLVKSEELREDPLPILGTILRFVGLEPYDFPRDVLSREHNVHNTTRRHPDFDYCLQAHRRPDTFLTSCNDRLATLLGDPKWHWWPSSSKEEDEL